jgi:hypothetical protein
MILAFYAILLCTPLTACESFMEALLSGFQRVVCRLAQPRIDGLNGLRPVRRSPDGSPPFKASTPECIRRSSSCSLFPWAQGYRFAFGRIIRHNIFSYFPARNRLSRSCRSYCQSLARLGFSVSEKLAPIEFYCADLAEQRTENLLPCPFTGHLTSVASPSEQLIFKRVR